MSKLFGELRLFITNSGPDARLEVGGELDLATIGELRDQLGFLVEFGTDDVELDLALVTFCDAAFLNALVVAHHELTGRGGRLRIVSASPMVTRLLQLASLDTTFPTDPLAGKRSRQEAGDGRREPRLRAAAHLPADVQEEGTLDAARPTHYRRVG